MFSIEKFESMCMDIKTEKIKRVAILSHNDLDGMAAIIIAKYFFGDVIAWQYNTSYNGINKLLWRVLLDKNTRPDAVLVTDISINDEKLIKYLREQEKRPVFLFDHHETARILENESFAVIDTSISGTKLFYNYCASVIKDAQIADDVLTPALKTFIENVNDYDMWHWVENGNQDASDLSIFASTVGQEFFETAMLEDSCFALTPITKPIIDTVRERIKWILVPAAKRALRGIEFDVPMVGDAYSTEKIMCGVTAIGGEFTSIISEELKESYSVVILISGTYLMFRTNRDDVDLSNFAEQFGGGGHAKSSGAQVNDKSVYIVQKYWEEYVKGLAD